MKPSIMSNQFGFKGCRINKGSGECVFDVTCDMCFLAISHLHEVSVKKDHDNIPHNMRVNNVGVEFRLNGTDTIAEYRNIGDALLSHNFIYNEVGYSLPIIMRYPLFARLKRVVGLLIPRLILWSSDKDPLVVVYDDCTYVISPVANKGE
ncbi:MAG: hypothetical protein KAJ39_06395 [Gammaproteobacteria bacterium]|nr:hypothetical protein [Gammaproteobacteria bacterium]